MKKLVLIFTMLLTFLLQAILILLWLHCMYLWCKMLKFLFSTRQEILWLYEIQSPPLDLNLKQMIKFTLPNLFSLWQVHNLCLLSGLPYEILQWIFEYVSYLSCVCHTVSPPLILTFQEQMNSTDYEASLWTVSHISATSSFTGP